MKHEQTRHFPIELERFLQENSRSVEWLVDTVRGPRMKDPITGQLTDQRLISDGLDERTKRIEKKLDVVLREMERHGGKAKLTTSELMRVAVGIGAVVAGIMQGVRLVFGG